MDVTSLCSELIRIRSENPPGDTTDITEYVRRYLDALGVQSRIIKSRPGLCSIVTRPGKKPLLCSGHLDVVPAIPDGWSHSPFAGTVEDGIVWGRGATDMKGGCAALLTAYGSLVEQGIEPAVDLAFVCDEESGGVFGMQYLVEKKYLSPCDCLIAEPTPDCHPSIGQKGLLRFSATFTGEPGHASLYPDIGVSAIMEAYAFIEYVRELHTREFRIDESVRVLTRESVRVLQEVFGMKGLQDVLCRIMFNPGVISGGEKANIVAQQCLLEMDLRIPWGCDIPLLIRDLESHAPRAEFSIQNSSAPSLTLPDRKIVSITCEEIRKQYPGPVTPILQWAATDARHMRNTGFDVIEYGPGDVRTLHSIDERVPVETLVKAADIYRGIMLAYTGTGNKPE
ncbi:MAG: ArgE/DapE family deacylase [Methanoregulaceae archaeon]